MKILFVSGNMCNGGAQRVIANVSNSLAEKGYDVRLLLFSRNTKEYPISDKVKITALGQTFEEYSQISSLSRMKLIRKYLKETKPDVAVGFLEGGYALFLSSFGMKLKKVSSARINPQHIMTAKGLRAEINRRWFFHSDAVVLQTESQMEYVPEKLKRKSVIIANPVPEYVLKGKCESYQPKCRKLVMVGRLDDQKNYPMAFRAIQLVKERYPDVHLDVFGKGILDDELSNLLKEMNLTENVSMCGWTQNALEEYRKHDMFLMTSDMEGMPNALMEAMAVGLPCISTDCETGPADLIEDGVNGYLVSVNDHAALAEKMIHFMEMPFEERCSIAMKAHESMKKKFNIEIIAKKWEQLFKDLTGEK